MKFSYADIKKEMARIRGERVKAIKAYRKIGLTNAEIGKRLGLSGARVQQLLPGGSKYKPRKS